MKELTKEILYKVGFKDSDDSNIDWEEYCDETGRIRIMRGITNRRDCDWYVHVDNWDFDTIGSLDFQYIDELIWFFMALGEKDLVQKFSNYCRG